MKSVDDYQWTLNVPQFGGLTAPGTWEHQEHLRSALDSVVENDLANATLMFALVPIEDLLPDEIHTLEEVEALPVGTVLRDVYKDTWHRFARGWYVAGSAQRRTNVELLAFGPEHPDHMLAGPLAVLYVPKGK